MFTLNITGLLSRPEMSTLAIGFSKNRIHSYPSVLRGSPFGGIPNEIEDILLLLRLYKYEGEISFIKLAITLPNGNTVAQLPYRAMNDLNSFSFPPSEFGVDECKIWTEFAEGMRSSQSWASDWFAAAKRFFLSGGAKRFNPKWDDVDRIVDYATALESTLVPEQDYTTRRISRRAAALIAQDDPTEMEQIVRLMKKLYDIRSRLVHGSRLDDEQRRWLSENCNHIEHRVRQVLRTAVQRLPAGEQARRATLAGLYDPTDEDRGGFAIDKFREIKTAEVRRMIAAKIAQFAAQ